jgi:hypothetical protein
MYFFYNFKIFSMILVYKEKYKELLNRLKASNIPKKVQSLLVEEGLIDDSCEEMETKCGLVV